MLWTTGTLATAGVIAKFIAHDLDLKSHLAFAAAQGTVSTLVYYNEKLDAMVNSGDYERRKKIYKVTFYILTPMILSGSFVHRCVAPISTYRMVKLTVYNGIAGTAALIVMGLDQAQKKK